MAPWDSNESARGITVSRRPSHLRWRSMHQEGELGVTLDGTKETLAGPGTLVADPGGRFQPSIKKDLPTWMTETEQSLKDQKLGEQFLEQFSKDRSVMEDTVLATESESPVTKKLAILAVKALGDLSYVTPLLYRKGDRGARQSTAAALRAFLSRGTLGRQAVTSKSRRRVRRQDRSGRRETADRLFRG